MTVYKLFFLLIACALCFTKASAQDLNDFNWLAGEWISKNGKTITTETWTIRNDSTLVGTGLTKKSGELVFEEALQLQGRNDEVNYIALLPSKVATFKLTESSPTSFSVSDPTNDFPSTITYRKTKSGMQVELLGKDNKEVIDFVRKTK